MDAGGRTEGRGGSVTTVCSVAAGVIRAVNRTGRLRQGYAGQAGSRARKAGGMEYRRFRSSCHETRRQNAFDMEGR